MVAAGFLVDRGRAAEFAPGDHQRRVQQAALFQVLDQGGVGTVPARQEAAPLGIESQHVGVPPAQVDRDQPHAGLDQPPGQQNALAPGRRAAALGVRGSKAGIMP